MPKIFKTIHFVRNYERKIKLLLTDLYMFIEFWFFVLCFKVRKKLMLLAKTFIGFYMFLLDVQTKKKKNTKYCVKPE